MNYTMMQDQLTGNYKEALEKAELYGIAKNIDSDILDEMMMNLFDMLLSAQTDQKPIEKIIGNDIEIFCHEYFRDYDFKERLKLFPKKIYSIMKYVLLFATVDALFFQDENISFLKAKSNFAPILSGFIMGILLIVITDFILSHTIFRLRTIKRKTYSHLMSLLFIVGMMLSIFISFQMSIVIKSWIFILISLTYIIIYIILRSWYRYKRTDTIHKAKKPINEYSLFSDFSSIKTSIETDLPKALIKKYEKINKKRVKKGLSELSSNEYLDMLRKENHQLIRLEKIMRIVFIVVTISLIIIVALTCEPVDTLIFALILSTIEYIIYYVYQKMNHKIIESREKILQSCESQGISLNEYINRQ